MQERRTEKRWPKQIPIRLVVGSGREVLSEDATTENISRHGACVLSELPINSGRYLMVINPEHPKSFVAMVRARRKGTDERTRLHLEFVNQEWLLVDVE